MRRGDVHIAAARGAYTGKPRPVVVVQDDRFDATGSVTVCPLTSYAVDAPLLRLPVVVDEPDQPSFVMIDKIVTVPRTNVRERIGRLSDDDLVRLNRAMLVFLGLAG